MNFEDWIKIPLTKQLISALHQESMAAMRELSNSNDPEKDKILKAKAQIYSRLADLDGLELFIDNPDAKEGIR